MRVWMAAAVLAWSTAQASDTTTAWAISEYGTPVFDESLTHWPYATPDAPKGGRVTLADWHQPTTGNARTKSRWESSPEISPELRIRRGPRMDSIEDILGLKIENNRIVKPLKTNGNSEGVHEVLEEVMIHNTKGIEL